jgi:hypothetical protein
VGKENFYLRIPNRAINEAAELNLRKGMLADN